MAKVIYQFKISNYTILKLDTSLPIKKYSKYLINNEEYEIVPIYDAENCIAVESNKDFLGKIVNFI